MLDDDKSMTSESTGSTQDTADAGGTTASAAPPAKKAAAKKAPAKKTAAKKSAPAKTTAKTAAKKTTAKKAAAKKSAGGAEPAGAATTAETADTGRAGPAPMALLFQTPEPIAAPRRARKVVEPAAADEAEADKPAAKTTSKSGARPAKKAAAKPAKSAAAKSTDQVDEGPEDDDETDDESAESEQSAARRRRRRGGRRRRKPTDGEDDESYDEGDDASDDVPDSGADGEAGGGTRRRRVRVRAGEGGGDKSAGEPNTVTRVRKVRSAEDEITSVQGSTRLEAKKQRRREGREAGRRRAPIVSEAEFLARRESVDRVMVIRQRDDLTQIAVLEDKVLVEHYVARESQTSLIGNVYLGRVQNVLPSMEAAFIDIGKGRNAVLYAGEVNWSSLGHKDGQPRKIESVLSSGQSILVQVTKDPIGHKGARLTSQVSLAGRFLVYVPDGTTSGISRKLPDTERNRLKTLLKEIVPDTAGVIVRTAAEGASEEELTHDVERLKSRWESIEAKVKSGNSPQLLYGEPDLTLKVVRDLFTEDFGKLVIQGEDAWNTVKEYVADVAPDLEPRLERYDNGDSGKSDVFAAYRIDEQIAKGLDRKVWLPSGGSLVIDRTEAMTVVDVNTGKFTGSGGNLEETVTKNNLEAAEEVVRQLRLRDIGGIIVVDFIDMVLESNRDLVLRRLVECLGRDRTRHQVAEVTSLGLVQMTRKRIGTGLLEAFSENCEHCQGRGVLVHDMPVESKKSDDGGERRGRRSRGGRGGEADGNAKGGRGGQAKQATPSPMDVAAVAKAENAEKAPLDEVEAPEPAHTEVTGSPAVEETETDTPVTEEGAERPSRDQTEPGASSDPDSASADEPEPAEAEPAATAPVEAAPPAAPKVVTRTRRAASRPAGATAGTPALEPVALVVPEPMQAEETHSPVVEPPKVITRTRRVVSRPAGAAAPAAKESADGSTDEHPSLELHVPIKKKGARKR
jgi:ribonuclease E